MYEYDKFSRRRYTNYYFIKYICIYFKTVPLLQKRTAFNHHNKHILLSLLFL